MQKKILNIKKVKEDQCNIFSTAVISPSLIVMAAQIRVGLTFIYPELINTLTKSQTKLHSNYTIILP